MTDLVTAQAALEAFQRGRLYMGDKVLELAFADHEVIGTYLIQQANPLIVVEPTPGPSDWQMVVTPTYDFIKVGDMVTVDKMTGKVRKATSFDENVFAMPPFKLDGDVVLIDEIHWSTIRARAEPLDGVRQAD